MNNKSKNIITLIIIILIIIIIGILFLIKKLDKKTITDDREIISETTLYDTLVKENTRSYYYTVKNIIEKYYYSLCNLNKTIDDVEVFENDEETEHLETEIATEIEVTKKRIYDFFDENYIKETGLTIDNLQEKLGNYKDLHVLIEDMYVRDISLGHKIYFASGTITEKRNANSQKFQLMLVMDLKNSTFNLYTEDYINRHNLYELSKQENLEKTFNVEKRTYNKYENKTVNDEQYAKELLKNYTQSIKYNNLEYSYNRLEQQYKTNKFANFADYEKYIELNRSNILKSNLKYYKKNVQEEFTQYICVDGNERYYIFNEYAVMDYDLILDIYTVDVKEFAEKYENSSEDEKVLINAQKLIFATKDGDYKYVYNKLDNNFKTTKYPTQASFENYIKEKYKENDKLEFTTYEKIGDTHIYRMNVKKGNGSEIKAQIIMKLNEGTDFVMSFSVDE